MKISNKEKQSKFGDRLKHPGKFVKRLVNKKLRLDKAGFEDDVAKSVSRSRKKGKKRSSS